MIDLSKLAYKVYLLRENGEYLSITDITESGSWDESEGELAMRFSLTLANRNFNGKKISSLAKPNCWIVIQAEIDGKPEEVARGKITEWSPTISESTETLTLGGYDILYDLEKSQDNRYVSEGVGTKSVIITIFDDWGIPVDRYEGPNNANAKTTFKNEHLSDIILELLDTAHKHGERECIVRAEQNKVSIIPKGSNGTVYHFEQSKNIQTVKYGLNAGDVVTVVKVVATEDDDDRQKVEAIIEGNTEYGKRQEIYVRDKDDTLQQATDAAKEILNEKGKPSESFSLKAPDVPFIRKGDKIYVTTSVYTGYALVTSISHSLGRTMSLSIEKYEPVPEPTEEEEQVSTPAVRTDIKKGDIVNFNGGYHYYTSMDDNPRGGMRTAGKAYVEAINLNGKHQYALIGGVWKPDVGGSSDVYGWVDANTVS